VARIIAALAVGAVAAGGLSSAAPALGPGQDSSGQYHWTAACSPEGFIVFTNTESPGNLTIYSSEGTSATVASGRSGVVGYGDPEADPNDLTWSVGLGDFSENPTIVDSGSFGDCPEVTDPPPAAAAVVGDLSPAAGTLGGEPPDFGDFGSANPTFTVVAGTNTVTGHVGPAADDPQDSFNIFIPDDLELMSMSYSGPDRFPGASWECNDPFGAPTPEELFPIPLVLPANWTFEFYFSDCTLHWLVGATDGPGPWTATFEVRPATNIAPTLFVPDPQTVEATSPSGAVAPSWPTATDDVDTPIVWCRYEPSTPSGDWVVVTSDHIFPLGTTTVPCLASDRAVTRPIAIGTLVVTVVDTTGPGLTKPDDQTIEATSPDGAAVTFTATATDIVDGTRPVTCNPASGTVFALGKTTVECTASDERSNTATESFTVTVVDTIAPTLTVSDDITMEATSANGAAVTFPAATATDDADSAPRVECSATSGDTFDLGTTTVTCTARDDGGNQASATFDVTVSDSTAPSLALPGDTFAAATGPSGANVDYVVTASDLVDTSPTIDCVPASGSLFQIGVTVVKCTAKDASGNLSEEGSFNVTVGDAGDPVLQLPANQVVEASGPDGAEATFDVTATDDVDLSPEITCTHASGDTFPIGDTTVDCTATDDDGNATRGGFSITVRDTSAPVIDLPDDIDVEASGADGAVVTWDVTATDSVAGTVPVTCAPPSGTLFPVGTTTVTCTASDGGSAPLGFFAARRPQQVAAANVATATFTVTVAPQQVDTTTTEAATTTTEAATTTTDPAPTTTDPTTTTVTTTAPTTTSPATLPATGTSASTVAATAAACLATGLALLAAVRRRRA